eukprot:TRINITY_DN6843_c0_g1_i1.p1 TRINITY_DN6843_c0_g1~~TRINITY_DN6843_c0_g1_i1.p1  ORF type:complete len:102 (-),score=5.95 TRINITY_DN6843_c0_g1_i1:47-352(-)
MCVQVLLFPSASAHLLKSSVRSVSIKRKNFKFSGSRGLGGGVNVFFFCLFLIQFGTLKEPEVWDVLIVIVYAINEQTIFDETCGRVGILGHGKFSSSIQAL